MRKLIFLLMIAAAACGDREYKGEEVPPPDTAGGRPDLSRPDAGPRVMATLSDSGIALSEDSVKMVGSGQITFVVKNEGTEAHNFKIDGDQQGEWSAPIPAGHTIFMGQMLARGSYQLLWPEDGSGQKKTFKVY